MDILLFTIQTCMNVFAMLDIWMILYLLFGCDMKVTTRNLGIASAVFVVLFVAVSIVLEGHNSIIFALVCIYNIVVTILLTRSRKVKTVLLTIPAVLVYAQFGAFMDLFEKLAGLDRLYIMNSAGELETSIAMISDGTLFLLLVLLGRTKVAKSKSIQLTMGEAIAISVFCVFSPVIVIGLEWFEGLANDHMYHIVWVLFMIVVNVAVVYAIAHRKRATYYQRLSEGYKKEFEEEYSFFMDYKKQQTETMKFRHDWKNHMLLLQEMLEKEEYEKAEDYFRELTSTTLKTVQKIATGNELVDMILSTKMNALTEQEIVLECRGDWSVLSFMKQVDCCILLSNLLDNAIEANRKVKEKRYITMCAKKTESMLYLEFGNPMEGELVRVGEKIVTTKDEKKSHGIGLENVCDITAKYEGQYQITAQDNEYKMQMVFPV